MIMKEKLNYFSSKNCNIVGMTTVKDIDNNEMLFALDDWGILNIYKLNDDEFNINNDKNDDCFLLENIVTNNNYEENLKPPLLCFCFDNFNFKENRNFTSIYKYNNEIYITGDFNTFSFSIDNILNQIQTNINSKNLQKIKINQIEKKSIFFDTKINDNIIINGCHLNSNKLITYSNNGKLNLFDLETSKLICNYFNDSSINNAQFRNDNEIVLGGNNSLLKKFDIREKKIQEKSIFDIEKNIYIENNINSYKNNSELSYSIKSIEQSNNFLLVSCNNFIIKFNDILNICTKVYPQFSIVNTIYNYKNKYIIGQDLNEIYSLDNVEINIPLKYNTSINSIISFEEKMLCFGGNSNIIEIYEGNNIKNNLFNLYF